MPQHEVDSATFLGNGGKGRVVRRDNTYLLKNSQMKGAVGHWGVMRGVLPDAVWENW